MNKFLLSCLAASASFFAASCPCHSAASPNQTQDVSPIFPGSKLPFSVSIVQADFTLPGGIQSYVSGTYEGKWLLLAGRTNGLHGFGAGPQNFPPSKQNTVVYVVDPAAKTVAFRSLDSPGSGLTQEQIDLLSVTSAQSYQKDDTLYMTGGYGIDTAAGQFSTKPCLTAIDIPGMIHWVTTNTPGETASRYIKQVFDGEFQICGGYMDKGQHDKTLLFLGQNFQGQYTPSSNGVYSEQVRRFHIDNDKKDLCVKIYNSKPNEPNPDLRRRDLNVVPIMQKFYGPPLAGYVALSGVFTPEGGAWTVPALFNTKGKLISMADPNDPETFKQGMNNYACANAGLFSGESGNMYILLFGGISYGYFNNGVFITDDELPFINQVTTVRINQNQQFKQYIMSAEYPFIASTGANPGNQLLFGAAAQFFPNPDLEAYDNEVIKLDSIKESVLLGYIVGGIQSTLPNTNTKADSSASAYIFKVFLSPQTPQ